MALPFSLEPDLSLAILVSNDFGYQSLFVLLLFSSCFRFSGSVLGVRNSKKKSNPYSSLKKLCAWGGGRYSSMGEACARKRPGRVLWD